MIQQNETMETNAQQIIKKGDINTTPTDNSIEKKRSYAMTVCPTA